jgi:putative ABC transport system substrate-binding protein
MIVCILLLALLVLPLPAEAQEAGKIARIGMLGPRQGDVFVEAFREGLRDLGYVEGRNISVEYRWTEGRTERLPGLAADLVRLKVDVIVASSQGAVAAKQATTTIPIVMPIITDPVRLGLVASLARPGGNATGFATQNEELPGKWLELVKETLPRVSRVAVLFHPTYDGGVQFKASRPRLEPWACGFRR